MKSQTAYKVIREVCLRRPDLAFKDESWNSFLQYDERVKNIKRLPYQGHCYVASHAFSMLVPEATIHTNNAGGHYWNEIDGEIWDLTAEQFPSGYDYSNSRKVPRKKNPTKRIRALLEEIDEKLLDDI